MSKHTQTPQDRGKFAGRHSALNGGKLESINMRKKEQTACSNRCNKRRHVNGTT